MLNKLFNIFNILINVFNKKPSNLEEDISLEDVQIVEEEPKMDIEKYKTLEFINKVKKDLFPYTPIQNIIDNWPLIVDELNKKELLNDDMVKYVLATLVVENDKFKPIKEKPSKYSDSDGQTPYDFSKYDKMTGLGNTPELDGDGELYCGSGFIQLTGKNNYSDMDKKLGLDGGLIKYGAEAANEPHIAAAILAQYFKDRESRINKALPIRDFITLRKIVNGGTIHLDKFKESFIKAEDLFS